MRQIKIIADGKPNGTSVVDADTGEEVSGVLYVKIHMDAEKDGVPLVELGLTDVPLEIVAEHVRETVPGFSGHFGE